MLFENLSKQRILYAILFHIGLGVLANISNLFMDIWYYSCAVWATVRLMNYQNKDEVAASASFYFVGMEVLARMVGAHVPWEGVKYIVIFFMFLGRAIGTNRSSGNQGAVIYFLLLLPSIFLIDYPDFDEARKQVSFNISGPMCLLFTALYFTKRTYSVKQLRSLQLLCILPMIATCTVIALRIPSLSEIKFQDAANFQLSGRYGPNQVASIMGFGLVMMILTFFIGFSLTGTRVLDIALTATLFVFCVINFSRGGIFTATLAVFLGALVWSRYSGSQRKSMFFLMLSVIFLATFVLFSYVDAITGNALSQRYAGSTGKKNPKVEQFGSGLSGRENLIESDIDIFKNYPIMGIGIGMSLYYHEKYVDKAVASHTEFTRLLCEHGSFGLLALLLLLAYPVISFRQSTEFYKKLFLTMLVSYSLICTLHAAMRIAMMGFGYGIAFMNLIPKRRDEMDPVAEYQAQSMIWSQYEEQILLT